MRDVGQCLAIHREPFERPVFIHPIRSNDVVSTSLDGWHDIARCHTRGSSMSMMTSPDVADDVEVPRNRHLPTSCERSVDGSRDMARWIVIHHPMHRTTSTDVSHVQDLCIARHQPMSRGPSGTICIRSKRPRVRRSVQICDPFSVTISSPVSAIADGAHATDGLGHGRICPKWKV